MPAPRYVSCPLPGANGKTDCVRCVNCSLMDKVVATQTTAEVTCRGRAGAQAIEGDNLKAIGLMNLIQLESQLGLRPGTMIGNNKEEDTDPK